MILARLKNDSKPILKLNNIQLKAKVEIEQKINNKLYKFETVSCEICNSNKTEIIGKKDRYGLLYTTNICKICGLVYTSPRMNQDSYNQFYNNEYRNLYVGKNKPTDSFFYSQLFRAKEIYNFINSFDSIDDKKLDILEIGCGSGGILKYFRDLGHSVTGCDLGSKYIQYGIKKYKLNLKVGDINSLKLENKPDVIIYSHVMEHILDLTRELKSIKKLCHQSTLVYIEVPGIKNVQKAYNSDFGVYFQNAHTFHFSLSSLVNIFNQNGFVLEEGTEYIRSIFKISPNEEVCNQKPVNDFDEIKKYIIDSERIKNTFLFKFSTKIKQAKSYFMIFLDVVGVKKIIRNYKLK